MENPEAAEKNCLPQDHLQIFWDTCGAHVIASDIAIWVLPIPMVWQLNFSKVRTWGGTQQLYPTSPDKGASHQNERAGNFQC